MISFTPDPIDPTRAYELLQPPGTTSTGSILVHYAVVKQQRLEGQITTAIEYAARGDVEENLEAIAATMNGRWQMESVLLVRRSGVVEVGEIISLVGVSSPNSADAFAACQFALESFKKMPTIAKREIYR
ncbi:MAG TPA: molybdenum cofactor biosynthesis protein MoaE [Desulfuromonadaceae bacterium]